MKKKVGSEDDTFIITIENYFFSFIKEIFFKLKISNILYTFVVGDTTKAKMLNLLSTDFQFCVELPIKIKEYKFTIDVYRSFERKRIASKKKLIHLKMEF